MKISVCYFHCPYVGSSSLSDAMRTGVGLPGYWKKCATLQKDVSRTAEMQQGLLIWHP